MPPAFDGTAAAAPVEPEAVSPQWWTRFGSPELNGLMAQALAANQELAAALHRVTQARAAVRVAGASLSPALDAGGSLDGVRRQPACEPYLVHLGRFLPRLRPSRRLALSHLDHLRDPRWCSEPTVARLEIRGCERAMRKARLWTTSGHAKEDHLTPDHARGNDERATIAGGPFEEDVRRRPTLPLPLGGSTIGAGRLNFRVRDGSGCFPVAMAAVTL